MATGEPARDKDAARLAFPLRGPRLNASYLVVFGITSVAYSGLVLLSEPPLFAELFLGFAILLAWGLNLIWLTIVLRDAANALEEEISIGPVRAFLFAGFACAAFPAWTAYALTSLARDLKRVALERNRQTLVVAISRSQRAGLEALVLIGLAFVMEWVILSGIQNQAQLEGFSGQPIGQAEALGLWNTIGVTVFRLGAAGFYLTFLSRAVPIFYEAYAALVAAGGRSESESR